MKNYGTSVTSDDYEGKYMIMMKNKFSSDNDLHLIITLDFYNMIIVVRSVFHEGYKYYSQVFLD